MIKKNIKVINVFMLLLYLILFFFLDYLNMSYKQMTNEYGILITVVNIVLNINMALLSAYLFIISSNNLRKAKKFIIGSNMSEMAILFGILTYGCTPCVVSLFATFSIPFVVVALPFGELLYKLVSLILIVVGILIVKKESSKNICKMEEGE